jgi:hypothetical protein
MEEMKNGFFFLYYWLSTGMCKSIFMVTFFFWLFQKNWEKLGKICFYLIAIEFNVLSTKKKETNHFLEIKKLNHKKKIKKKTWCV